MFWAAKIGFLVEMGRLQVLMMRFSIKHFYSKRHQPPLYLQYLTDYLTGIGFSNNLKYFYTDFFFDHN